MDDVNGKQWILTAAHCINEKGKFIPICLTELTVTAGSVMLNDDYNGQEDYDDDDVDLNDDYDGQTKNIPLDKSHIIFHPDWNGVEEDPGDIFCPYYAYTRFSPFFLYRISCKRVSYIFLNAF